MTIENDALYEQAVSDNTGAYDVVDWDGVAVDLNEAHVDSADTRYLDGGDSDVAGDQNDREALDNSAHTGKANAALDEVNTTTATVGGAEVPVYSGGNIVTDAEYDDFKQGVVDAVQAGTIFALSGQVPPESATAADDFGTEHVDPLMLIEASKLTGEKFF